MDNYVLKLSNGDYVKIIDDNKNFIGSTLNECSPFKYKDAITYAREINKINSIKVVSILKVKLLKEIIEQIQFNR